MGKSFNEIKNSIALLILEIKSLDPATKYSAIVHLEESIDLLKLEALKELPEENIKDEDGSSNNFDDDDDYCDSDDEGTLPESNSSNEPVADYENLSVEKSLYNVVCSRSRGSNTFSNRRKQNRTVMSRRDPCTL